MHMGALDPCTAESVMEFHKNCLQVEFYDFHIFEKYRKFSIRSRPCIILNPKFPRLVLEVFQKL